MKQFILFTLAFLTLSSAAFMPYPAAFLPLSRDLQQDPNAPPIDPNNPPQPQPVQPQPVVYNRPLFPPPPISEKVIILQRIFNGLYQQGGGQQQANLAACLDDRSAEIILDFLGDFYGALAGKDWLAIPGLVNKLRYRFAPAVPTCLDNDAGIQDLLDAYDLADETLSEIFVWVSTFAFTADYNILRKNLTDIKAAYKRGQYEIVGVLTGQLIQTIVNYDPETGLIIPPENNEENEEEEQQAAPQIALLQTLRNLGWGGYDYAGYGADDDDEEDETSEDGEYDSEETGDYALLFLSSA